MSSLCGVKPDKLKLLAIHFVVRFKEMHQLIEQVFAYVVDRSQFPIVMSVVRNGNQTVVSVGVAILSLLRFNHTNESARNMAASKSATGETPVDEP